MRLFLDRLRAVRSDVAVSRTVLAAAAEICRRLDGIPLAIELAAARARALAVNDIRDRLDRCLPLLGDTSERGRHATLRAAFAWSHDLLSEPARAQLRRLAVFSGGFDADAVEAVCEFGLLEPGCTIALLAALADASWVATAGAEPRARYRLLEPVRQYAEERLHDAGEDSAARDRHLAFFLSRAERDYDAFAGEEQREAGARLEADLDNLRVALDWALETDAMSGARLLTRLRPFWFSRGLL
ncbi:MAG: ATP-binding protein, partial [Actinomycetota bacterium]